MAEQFFNDGENIVLRHKTHLHVKLIELAGRTVRSCILVAETGCDLEITVESRNHKQLFELLRRLRQSIELAGMDTARNEIVTCAFRRTAGQDRGLIFHESHIAHEPADFGNDLGTQQNVLMQFFAAQIKKTVFQAQCFGCLLIFGYLERNDIRFPEDFHFLRDHLDLSGHQLRIDRLRRPCHDSAGKADDGFDAPSVQLLIEMHFGINDDLCFSVMVPKVDKNNSAVVPHAVNPAGELDFRTDIGASERSACMCSEHMHDNLLVKNA